MKKLYSSPEIKAINYAQFENVYTAGCTKVDGSSWEGVPCFWSANIDPSTDPDGTNNHKAPGGGGSI